MYIAGVVGLNLPNTAPLFKFLTPFNLFFSAIVLIYFHQDKNKAFWLFTFTTFLIGFLVEVIGVNTGLIFGKYEYLSTLGIKLFNVPLVIGLNWLLIGYCVGFITHQLFIRSEVSGGIKAAIAALIMTAFDYVVEPVAIRLDMWWWFGEHPPLSNYIGWFGTAFLIQIIYFYAPFKKENPVAAWLFILQAVFFGIQWLF
jgi:putative membrane protein